MTLDRTITHDALRDGWTMTRRELTQLRYAPGEMAAMVIFPGILVVLFGYIFGSAIRIPGGGNYREFLMPGLFAMTALAGVMVNAVLVSKDVANGVMDRFRSMPIIRIAVPFGLLAALAGFGLILLLRFALSWVGTYVGLCLRPETADQFVPLVFPVSMLSNSFVPTSGMPTVLRVIANWNPVSALVTACRNLFGNPSPAAASAWPLQHPYITTIAWSLALLAIFMPLASRRFARP
jgi:ABC-2 type transport system permease protein